MIRSEHSIVEYDFGRRIVRPDRLHRVADADYLPAARQLLQIYQQGLGQPRQSLHSRVEVCLSRLPACPPRRIAAFCKLLDDHSQYATDRKKALLLRRRVFDFAADRHPIVQNVEGIFDHAVDRVRIEIANELGMPWAEIENNLFSDVLELQRLQSIQPDLTATQLLSLYNVAQTQAALYQATRICIDATTDFKTIVRHAKLSGLMHRIEPASASDIQGYRFLFDGPQSVLQQTTRYGIRFAALIPKLLACRGWKLIAEILGPAKQRFRMDLSPRDGLVPPLDSPDEFDSDLESDIDAVWNANPVPGWQWERESRLIVRGQDVMTPDFTLYHPQQRILAYVEVVGFWTPEYLSEKCRRLRHFAAAAHQESHPESHTGGHPEVQHHAHRAETLKWLLIVPKNSKSDPQRLLSGLEIPIIEFDNHCRPQTWIDALQ